MAESEEELKSLSMKVKEESEKVGLTQHSENKDHGIWSHHFVANRWLNNEKSYRLNFLGSKITADGDFSCEIKRHLPLRVGKGSTCNAGDPGSIPGSGGSPGKGIGYPLQ